jgi:predicted  nucleic acid-binding Zn-ribbon protein
VGLLERLAEIGKALFTTESELRHLRDTLADIRQEVRGLADDVQDLRERMVRLETARIADRAQLEAEVARFKAEIERIVLRVSPPAYHPSEPPALPDTSA